MQMCHSVWACPWCAAAICGVRSGEVVRAVARARARGEHVVMLSVTVRHGLGDDLQAVRSGVTTAYRRMASGAPWKRWCAEVEYVGSIRALEGTHGPHGWHPHLHPLLIVRDVEALRASLPWLSARWRACVVRELGPQHEPDDAHGVILSTVDADGHYLAKLGLEVTSAGKKKAKHGNRTPWEIAEALAERGDPADARLWASYVEGMRGARMLTWSKGLRDLSGLNEDVSDDQVEEDRGGEVLAVVAAVEWWQVSRREDLCDLLDAAVVGGQAAVDALLWRWGCNPPGG